MNNSKLVSVIIPTYKRPHTLPRAITSVLNQRYDNIEIIVVDDNHPNTDERKETEYVMKNFLTDSRIRYIKHEKNKNGSAARNTGFRHSRGEYIMFLDDDDEFINNKISSQVAKLESIDTSWGACYTSYIRKKDSKIVDYSAERREGTLLKEGLMRNLFTQAGSNLMVRRNVVFEINGFDETFQRNQDLEFLTRILMKYKLAYVDEIGLVHNKYKNQIAKEMFEEITTRYLKKFSETIDSLPIKEKKMIYKMIDLQLFRCYLITKGKRRKAYKLIRDGKLSCYISFKYLIHLIIRKITKRVYGFQF